MKVTRISAITLIVLFLIVGICFGQSTGEYTYEVVQLDSEVRFDEECIEQIKQLVKGLEYSDKVAEDFVQMIRNWRDAQGRPILTSWKQRLDEAEDEYRQDRTSKDQLARAEEDITREISQRIQKEISFNIKYSNLADVIKYRQAQCVSYSLLVYLLGNSVGLSVEVIDVEEPLKGKLVTGWGHIANIVNFTDGKMMMVDLIPVGFISKPFILEKEYVKIVNYWELKDAINPLGIHRKIQMLDENMIIAIIYNGWGIAYSEEELYQKAISCFNKAIELNPRYASAYNSRGNVYLEFNLYTEAISDFTDAIEFDPSPAEEYYNRGIAYQKLGELDLAISDFTDAIELNQKFTMVYYNRGNVYLELRQYPEAISDFTEAIKFDPALAITYNNRGKAYLGLDPYLEAISDFTDAIELNPKLDIAYYNRGIVYKKSRKLSLAISDFTEAIDLNAKNGMAFYNRGVVYGYSGEFEKAKSDLLKAVELNPAIKSDVLGASDYFKLNLKIE